MSDVQLNSQLGGLLSSSASLLSNLVDSNSTQHGQSAQNNNVAMPTDGIGSSQNTTNTLVQILMELDQVIAGLLGQQNSQNGTNAAGAQPGSTGATQPASTAGAQPANAAGGSSSSPAGSGTAPAGSATGNNSMTSILAEIEQLLQELLGQSNTNPSTSSNPSNSGGTPQAAGGGQPANHMNTGSTTGGSGADGGGGGGAGNAGATQGAQNGNASLGGSPSAYDGMISESAHKWGVDPALVKAVISNESGFNPNATSPTGAQGLMQLEPGTAAGLGVTNAYDPAQNIDAGTHYLHNMLQQFHGNVSDAVAAYNAGPGAVQQYGGVPPYAETQNYVPKVLASYQQYSAGGTAA